MTETFLKETKALAESKGMNIGQLAVSCGMGYNNLYRYYSANEATRWPMNRETANRICSALGVEWDTVLIKK